MKLEALQFKITRLESVTPGVAEITAISGEESLVFQIITYTGKPIALSHHIVDAIEKSDMVEAHQLSSLFLSIYYVNKQEVEDFLSNKKYETRKLSV